MVNRNQKLLLYTLVVSGSLTLFGCLGKKDTSPVVARFDGQTLTLKELETRIAALPKDLQNLVTSRKKDYVEDLINEHFLIKEAERLKLDRKEDVRLLIESARKKIMVAKLLEEEVDRKVNLGAEEAAEYYALHKDEFMTPLLLRASHILVKTEEEALAIKAELTNGGDFEEIARKKSIDQTAARGGDLGFFQKNQFIPEFEEVAFSLKKGQISEVFKSQFGYHLVKVTDRIEPSVRDLSSIKPAIERQLINEKRSKKYKELVDRLKTSKRIQIEEKSLEEQKL